MPRPRTSTPKIYLHRASGWHCANFSGVRVRLAKGRAEAEEIYRDRLAAWLVGGRAAPPPKRSPAAKGLLVGEAMLAYVQHSDGRVCPKQLARIQAGADAVEADYGATPAAAFDQLALETVRDALLRRPSKRDPAKPLSRTYVNHLIGSVQAAWRWLASRKMISAASAMELCTLTSLREGEGGEEVAPIPPVDPAVVAATLPHLSAVVRAMVQVEQLTGMRPGEVCVMRRADLSCSPAEVVGVPVKGGKEIKVSAVTENGRLVWAYAPRNHKNRWRGKPRVIPIPPAAQQVLAPFMNGRPPTDYLFSPREASDAWRDAKGRRKKYGVGRIPGDRYTTGSYGDAVTAGCRRAGVPHFSPNQLRHSMADLVDAAYGRDAAAAVLGHANPSMTNAYISDTFRKAARAVAGLA